MRKQEFSDILLVELRAFGMLGSHCEIYVNDQRFDQMSQGASYRGDGFHRPRPHRKSEVDLSGHEAIIQLVWIDESVVGFGHVDINRRLFQTSPVIKKTGFSDFNVSTQLTREFSQLKQEAFFQIFSINPRVRGILLSPIIIS